MLAALIAGGAVRAQDPEPVALELVLALDTSSSVTAAEFEIERDGLTQAFNKRYFLEALERELNRAQRYQRLMSLAMFDIDHFKRINDSFGHLAGDDVLRLVGLTLL